MKKLIIKTHNWGISLFWLLKSTFDHLIRWWSLSSFRLNPALRNFTFIVEIFFIFRHFILIILILQLFFIVLISKVINIYQLPWCWACSLHINVTLLPLFSLLVVSNIRLILNFFHFSNFNRDILRYWHSNSYLKINLNFKIISNYTIMLFSFLKIMVSW